MGKWFKGFRFKMMIIVGISSGLFSVLGVFAHYELEQIGQKLMEANTVRIPMSQGSNEMATELQAIARYSCMASMTDSKDEFESIRHHIQEEVEAFEQNEKEFAKFPMDEFTKKKFEAILAEWPPLKTVAEESIRELEPGKSADRAAAARIIAQKIKPLLDKINHDVDELNLYRQKKLKESIEKDERELAKAQQILIFFCLLGFILVSVFGFLVAARMAGVLGRVVASLSHHSDEVAQASGGLSAAASSLSSGATETASSLEETVASTEELTSMVKTNADNAKQAAALAAQGQSAAETGEKDITQLHQAVGDVSKASKEIEQIISVIDDIAFQTNLLALNAAVEAARAGEQGKGFAVVAEAVRNLAQRSSVAAKDISNLIGDSVAKIETSRELAEKSKDSLVRIVDSIRKISDINSEIATASAEQSLGLTNISKAMNEIDRATQQNAASSEEISATSEQMTAQSTSLQGLVMELATLMDGAQENLKTSVHKEARSESPRANERKMHVVQGSKKSVATEKQKSSFKASSAQSRKAYLEEMLPMESDLSTDRKVSKVEGF